MPRARRGDCKKPAEMTYQFEWHWLKNLKNLFKHGIQFDAAATIFEKYDSVFKLAKKLTGSKG